MELTSALVESTTPNRYLLNNDLKMTTYIAFGEHLYTNLDFKGILPVTNQPPTVFLIEKEIEDQNWQKTKLMRKGENAQFYYESESKLFLYWNKIAAFEVCDTNKIYYQDLGTDEGTLKLFILSEVFGLILWQKNLFLLHGSAILVNNEAHVFVGVPGAGKSTTATAFWKNGNIVLSDDLVAVKLIDDKPYIIPALPQLKVWKNALEGLEIDTSGLKNAFEGIDKFTIMQDESNFPNDKIPLKQINFLQKPYSKIKNGEFPTIRAPFEMVKHFPLPIGLLNETYQKKHFLESLLIAKKIKLVNQRRPKTFTALNDFVRKYTENN